MTSKLYDRVIQRFLLRHIRAGSRLVDVGCGTGWTALLLARHKRECRVEGIDINRLKIHRANRLFLKAKRDHLVTCQFGEAEKLSMHFGRAVFDYAVIVHSFHHFIDQHRALSETRAILKPSGTLLLADLTPEYGKTADACARFSLKQIRMILKKSKFTISTQTIAHPGVILITAHKPR